MTHTIADTVRDHIANLKDQIAKHEKVLAILEDGLGAAVTVTASRIVTMAPGQTIKTKSAKRRPRSGARVKSGNGAHATKANGKPLREIVTEVLKGGPLPRKALIPLVLKSRKTSEGTIGGTLNAMHKAGAVKNIDGKWELTAS